MNPALDPALLDAMPSKTTPNERRRGSLGGVRRLDQIERRSRAQHGRASSHPASDFPNPGPLFFGPIRRGMIAHLMPTVNPLPSLTTSPLGVMLSPGPIQETLFEYLGLGDLMLVHSLKVSNMNLD